jgi:hypothetical protein
MTTNLDYLTKLTIREFATVTGGAEITEGQARLIIRGLTEGRALDRPGAYIVRAIRDAPDPFRLLLEPEIPQAPPKARQHPSSRTVAEALGADVYAKRRAQVLAYYAEDARRREAGEPYQWQERAGPAASGEDPPPAGPAP